MSRLLLALALLPFFPLSPVALAQAPVAIVGNVVAQPERDAVTLEWEISGDSSDVAYYVIAYAHASFASLGRSAAEGTEETYDNSTSFTLRDLLNRGFMDGQQMYLAVAAVNTRGIEGPLSPEVSFTVRGPLGLLTGQADQPIPPSDTVPPPPPLPPVVEQPSPLPLPPVVPRADTVPPEDPTGLMLAKSLSRDQRSYIVKMSWQPSANTTGDLQNYNLYESGDRGANFLGPVTVAATILSATLTDVPPGTLTVKVTAKDRSGNESKGVVKTILLPDTGPGLAFILSLLGAGLGTPVVEWRRKQLATGGKR
jgi:hypothetical protein